MSLDFNSVVSFSNEENGDSISNNVAEQLDYTTYLDSM